MPDHRIGLQPGTKALRIERNSVNTNRPVGSWCLWIHTANFQTGTYMKLYDDGMIERVTLYDDGHEDVWLIKPED